MRCLDSTYASSAGTTSSPNNWSPASCRDASRQSTAAPSTSGRPKRPSALACPGGSSTTASTSASATGWALGDGLIRAVLPRRSAIVRNAAGLTTTAQTLAANVDVAFVVSSLGPDLEPRRIERYLVTLWESGASPEIVLTKADRLDDPWPLVAEVEAVALGVPVHVVSAVTGQGCDALRARIAAGATAVLLGSSGVGKSTLVNHWLGEEAMATKETRDDDDEGRHTTTHRQLLVLPGGGMVIDTPGLRELQLWDVGSAGLDATFADVEELAADCRFADCTHVHEPECAVLAAVEIRRAAGRAPAQLAQAPARAARDRDAPRRAAPKGGGAEVEAAGARGPRAGEAPLEPG